MLEKAPKINAGQIVSGRYEEKFETYFSDQFLLRDMWIEIKAGFDRLTGKVESNGVYLGKDGYLIESFTEPDKKNLEKTCRAMGDFAERHKDIKQYAMVVPNAVEILSDKLPAFAPGADQGEYLDELGTTLEKQGISFLDMRSVLEKNRDKKLYYKTDHHWTTEAAYLAFWRLGRPWDIRDPDRVQRTACDRAVPGDIVCKERVSLGGERRAGGVSSKRRGCGLCCQLCG